MSSHTSEDIERLGSRFTAQEAALIALEARLLDSQETLQITSLAESAGTANSDSASERDLTARLQTVCQDALLATKAKRTGQSFGDQQTDTQSVAMQGIVGAAQSGVELSFGNQKTTNSSRVLSPRCSGNENNGVSLTCNRRSYTATGNIDTVSPTVVGPLRSAHGRLLTGGRGI